jgi:FkbM family methyltransferase
MLKKTYMERMRAETFWEKEPETLEWIRSFDHDGSTFFDIGANIGIYSLYCAAIYPRTTIVAFEPMKKNIDALRNNKNINKFRGIYCKRYAVSSRKGLACLEVPKNISGVSGSQIINDVKDGIILENVPMISIDDFLSKNLDFEIPDYVKIDIDGQELAVIQGMTKTLPYVKSILIEVSRASKQPIMDILTAAGFTTDNRFNKMTPHSRERREKEGIDAENIIFTR